jgi:hypothetical protein
MNKTNTIKSVLIVVILMLVGVLGVLGINTAKTYMGAASADTEPKNVLAKPSDDGKTATITWSSDKSTMGIVEYGTSPAALLLRAPESESSVTHSVVLSPLKANISYYFRIRVGEEIFDNNGIPYSFKTKPATQIPTAVPTAPKPTVACVKGTDTMAYINCLRGQSATTPTGTGGGKCPAGVDYNKDGVINSLDRIQCLQNK